MATHIYLGTLLYDSGGGNYVALGKLIKFTPSRIKVGETKDSDR